MNYCASITLDTLSPAMAVKNNEIINARVKQKIACLWNS